jgi:hypothetical protein
MRPKQSLWRAASGFLLATALVACGNTGATAPTQPSATITTGAHVTTTVDAPTIAPQHPATTEANGTTEAPVTRIATIENLMSISIDGALVVGAEGDPNQGNSNTLGVYDISAPEQPAQLATLTLPGAIQAVHLADNTAYVSYVGNSSADAPSSIAVVDLRDPGNPTVLGSYDTDTTVSAGGAFIAEVVDNRIYLLHPGNKEQRARLEVLDIGDPEQPQSLSKTELPGYIAEQLAIAGDRAYLLYPSGLEIIDISNPEILTTIGQYEVQNIDQNTARAFQLVRDRAYIATNDGLEIVDLSDEQQPAFLGSIATPYYAGDVQVDGARAYVAFGNYGSTDAGGIAFVDVSDPRAPKPDPAFTFDAPTPATNPDNPLWRSSYALSGQSEYDTTPFGMSAVGDLLFVTSSEGVVVLRLVG